jgi:prepilin-type N-terminal cleavage/methylation domain-containing protein
MQLKARPMNSVHRPVQVLSPSRIGERGASGVQPAAPRRLLPVARTGAFTLLEVLLAVAIIALIASVLVGGSLHLLTDKPVTLEEVFWKSVQEARKHALKAEHEMRLKFDARKKQFVIVDGIAPVTLAADGFTREEEVPIKAFPVPPTAATELSIDFLAATKSGNMILIGGVLLESQSIPFVTFYPDGTCSPFRIQFARPSGTHTLTVDPWTCAPMLTPGEPGMPALP